VTQLDLIARIAKQAELSQAQAEALLEDVFAVVGRELSVGEPVEIEGLGRFYTIKYPATQTEDPAGSGHIVISLPTVEPEWEPDPALASTVLKQVAAHPDLFDGDADEDLEEAPAENKTPEITPVPLEPKTVTPKPIIVPEPVKPLAPAAKAERPLGRASQIQYFDLSNKKVERSILQLLPENLARQLSAVPIELEEGVLTVAMIDPEDFDALQVVRRETSLTVKPVLTGRDDLQAVLDQYTGFQAEIQESIDASELDVSSRDLEAAQAEDIDQTNDNAPTAKIVFSLLKRAVKERASDIHIEPYEKKVVVRFRVDGILQKRLELPKEIQGAVTSRLKIMANLKIDEQRLPQDGRLSISFDKHEIDFRFSTIPVVNGEKIVMRILDKSVGIISLEQVGLADHGFDVLKKNSKRSHGMILVTGPTGSGKTTSLYAVLGTMMSDDVNILTLEDPVEYRIESINQSQVHTEIGYSFANGLRAVVRQDPDIVMLGEIRDGETATMAIQAALTGHIVLSTLHTNDAAGAFPRLIDMGIEPFLLTSSIHTVIAQRLTRKICNVCKYKIEVSDEEVKEVREEISRMAPETQKTIKEKELEFYMGKGCQSCGGKGYKGRLGVFEVLDVSEPIRDLVLKRSSNALITQQAVKEGMVTMVQDGIIKALRGQTSLEEVWRVTRE
jgi:type II secretory ATPase GspE/PulE/Tfp pilus assembly ATPase PilB-like protein/nucleoid DNA-binding protein